jgi:hypothetical protein
MLTRLPLVRESQRFAVQESPISAKWTAASGIDE